MSSRTPYRSRRNTPGGKTPVRENHGVNDKPVVEFNEIIDTVPVDQWQRRTDALQKLISTIPSNYNSDECYEEGTTAWYSSPKVLRHLARSASKLFKDARSSVVKEVCILFSHLFLQCRGDAKYLLKDILPAILDVHAQTAAVIRTNVQNMVAEILPAVPCKAAMPEMLDRLKSDKSKTVREACALYLCIAIVSWTDEGYLSKEVLSSVGTVLIKAMRDPSPSVREQAKKGLGAIRQEHPGLWESLVNDPDGPAAKDQRLQKMLQKSVGEYGVSLDDFSVASRGSQSIASRRSQRSTALSQSQSYKRSSPPKRVKNQMRPTLEGVPTSVVVGDTTSSHSLPRRKGGGGLGPPMRVVPKAQQQEHQQRFASTLQSPERRIMPPPTMSSPPLHNNRASIDSYSLGPRASVDSILHGGPYQIAAANDLGLSPASTITHTARAGEQDGLQFTFSATDDEDADKVDEGPFIGSFNELKRQAKKSRRRSSILQERFRMSSSSNLVGDSYTSSNIRSQQIISQDKASTPALEAEHMSIARQLLDIHRTHVDHVMETLRMEMDTMRDFEQKVTEEAPTEDEVLTYFESMAICLDQRNESGKVLQTEMDRIAGG